VVEKSTHLIEDVSIGFHSTTLLMLVYNKGDTDFQVACLTAKQMPGQESGRFELSALPFLAKEGTNYKLYCMQS
jgi:hypothetical protein